MEGGKYPDTKKRITAILLAICMGTGTGIGTETGN